MMDVIVSLGACGLVTIGLFYWWIRKNQKYWSTTSVSFVPSSLLFGNFKEIFLLRKSVAESISEFYNHKNAVNQPIVGINVFHKPGLIIRSPELCKQILVKDFNVFSNRYSSSDPVSDPLGTHNLFFLKNPAWKGLRAKLSPLFSSGKMKQMFAMMQDIGAKLDQMLVGKSTVDIKDVCSRYTIDVIASCAFGVEANSLTNPNAEFREKGKVIFNFTPYRAIEFTSVFFLPAVVSWLKFKVFSNEASEFIRSTIIHVMKAREGSNTKRNDLIDTLITLKNEDAIGNGVSGVKDIKLQGDVLYAQAAAFFTAGFETSATTMCFSLYELAKSQDVQKRLRTEIHEHLKQNNDQINYDTLHEMKYLDMVVSEVLRMYPPLPFLDRICEPENNGQAYRLDNKFSIPRGMPVFIPVYAIQRDPKYFPNPDKFDPERFADKGVNVTPYAYMPFGVGPRNCIGERFGFIQTKLGLIYSLKNQYFVANKNTPKTINLEAKALIIQSDKNITLDTVRDVYKSSK